MTTDDGYFNLPANSEIKLKVELELWKIKLTNSNSDKPKTAIETLIHCEIYYPNIIVLLQMLGMFSSI